MTRRLFALIGVALLITGYYLLWVDPHTELGTVMRMVAMGQGSVLLGAVFVAAALFWGHR